LEVIFEGLGSHPQIKAILIYRPELDGDEMPVRPRKEIKVCGKLHISSTKEFAIKPFLSVTLKV
jgi:hypothetical protein